jgi:predicted Zn-dependent protease
VIALFAPLALAGAPEGQEVDALRAELDRNAHELALPNAPPIYLLRYHLMELDQYDVLCSFGAVVREQRDPFNLLAVEVRVGSPQFDNSGFGGWQDGFLRSQLPEVLTPASIQAEAWRTTDVAYKQAVEQYARKQSQFTPPPDWPGDYTMTGPVVADEGEVPEDERLPELLTTAKAMSAALADTAVLRGEVYVGHEAGTLLTLDTEGTEVRRRVGETTLRAVASVRADDGQLLTDQRLWTAREVAALPTRDQLVAEVAAMRDHLLAEAKAAPLDDEYVGPVVFEGDAALDLFRYVLVGQLEGTPPEIPFDSFFGELGDDRDPVRLGRRVLPPGWTVSDDPQALPASPGSYAYDDEGTPAKAITLVDDGIVKDLAMSRVPRKGLDGTNGHARGLVGERAIGRVTMLQVEPDRHRTQAKLVKKGLQLAKAYGRDWVVVVRKLQEPCVMGLESQLVMDDDKLAVPPPVEVVRRYADGHEEPFRGASFAGIQRWVLRDLVAAGPERQGDWFAPFTGRNYAGLSPTEGMASHLWAPDVLVGEVELVPAGGEPREIPVVPPPVATTQAAPAAPAVQD